MPDAGSYFESQLDIAGCAPEVAEMWRECAELYRTKLWHQLTVVLLKLVKTKTIADDGNKLKELYTEAIHDVENKLNALNLVVLIVPIVPTWSTEEERIKFLEKIGKKVKRNDEAFAYTRVLVGQCKLKEKNTDVKVIKDLIAEIEPLLDNVGVGLVHKEFYSLCSEFYRLRGDHAEYYRAALRYLGCSELKDSDEEQNKALAVHLCLAAILGEDVFNFGELLAHPVLEGLKGGESEWLIDLLKAFNHGDVKSFESLKKQWQQQADLKAHEMLLYEKLCLLALMDMAFNRSVLNRQMTFVQVSERTGLSPDKVELLVMKALSKGLVKGSIDQVSETILINWVQPRVLDKAQIGGLLQKVDDWSKSVQTMEKLIENNAADILTA